MSEAANQPKKPTEPDEILAKLKQARELLESVCGDLDHVVPSDIYLALCYTRAAVINHGDRFQRLH